MLTKNKTPLILAVLLKPPYCTALAFITPGGGRQLLTSTPLTLRAARPLSTPSSPAHFPQRRPTTSTKSDMGKKRPWEKKKEERAKSFAKRERRASGWGDYGTNARGQAKQGTHQHTGGASDGGSPEGAISDKAGGNQRHELRRSHEVHPGSYAGALAETLSDERRLMLKERLARDESLEPDATAAPPTENDGDGTGEPSSSATSKKKVALLISYWGSNYKGLQINENAKTVEAEVELALYLAGALSKDNFGNLRKVSWSRSGRTDKGVHAAAQLISVKLTYPNDREAETIEAINTHLPDDIRIIDIKRAPKSFDSRTRCSGRRYEYLMPTFVLAPREYVATLFQQAREREKDHLGEDSAPDAEAIDGESAVTAVASEPTGRQHTEKDGDGVASDHSSDHVSLPATARVITTEVGSAQRNTGKSNAAVEGGADAGEIDGEREEEKHENEEGENDYRQRPVSVELSSPAVVHRVAQKLEEYRLPAESLETLRETLRGFLGTKNYHNYTNNKQPTDPSCKRLITSFTAAEPFEHDGMEWVRVTVEGQSFILHQIRKMVAATVDRVRGQSSKEDFIKSFYLVKLNMGIAPSEGLYLERPLYDSHNQHMKRQGAHDRTLAWETGPAAEAMENFKKNKIQAGILSKEKVERDFVAWLDRMTRYPCSY